MMEITDILLDPPLDSWLLDLLMFVTFTLHFIFVLLLIGTAVLSVYYFTATWFKGERTELPWFKEILKTFLAHKSIAVVLGVGALLLIQVGYSVPFFMGISLFAGFWMLIIVFLIVSFLSFDLLGHGVDSYNRINLPGGIISLIFLLVVPGIFVAVLASAENSGEWVKIINNNGRISATLSIHWLFRYLHVLGGAVVFGAAFHYFFSTKNERVKKQRLMKWTINGLLFQLVVGILLFATVIEKFTILTYTTMFVGIIFSLIFLWSIIERYSRRAPLDSRKIVSLLLLVLLPMLLTRQDLQFKGFNPVIAMAESNKKKMELKTAQFEDQAIEKYEQKLKTIHDTGEEIYANSCSFCHGSDGDGNGIEAHNLRIPPEKLNSVKMDRSYLYTRLRDGVDGTGMPYFSYYLDTGLGKLMDYLDDLFKISGQIKIADNITPSTQKKALQVYSNTCAVCHGVDFKGDTELSRGFTPVPPDFNRFSVSTQRAFDVITNGYDGTMMVRFNELTEDVRYGLIEIIQQARKR